MKDILAFIEKFQSPTTEELFTNSACYWFASILHQRFPGSKIVYDPTSIHFATEIDHMIYDITGLIEDTEDYWYWEDYAACADDVDLIIDNCIKMRGCDDR